MIIFEELNLFGCVLKKKFLSLVFKVLQSKQIA